MPLIPYFIDCPRCGFEGEGRATSALAVPNRLAVWGLIGGGFVWRHDGQALAPVGGMSGVWSN
jgi:hypothetical protein